MISLGWATGRENCHDQYTGLSSRRIHEIFALRRNFSARAAYFAVRICPRSAGRLKNRRIVLKSTPSNIRLLQFAPRVPWPLDTGAKLRNYHLGRVLSARALVALICFEQPGATTSALEMYSRLIKVPLKNTYSFGKLLRGAIGSTPLPLLNYTSDEMKRALSGTFQENVFDLVQVESIHLMNYLPIMRAASSRPLIVCDWHNVESDLMLQYAKNERNPGRKAYARRTARLLAEFEARALDDFDAHLTVSHDDAERLRRINPRARILVIQNGVDVGYFAAREAGARSRIVFVGSMDYHANIEGVIDFATNVWPGLRRKHPELVFTVVGRDPAPAVRDLAKLPGVIVTGSVEDVRPYYREALLAVVPLNIGGGSRLKILEAMAAGVPVVSTLRGAEGLMVTDRENILLVDSTDDLAVAITQMVEHHALRQRIVSGGRALVTEHYDWQSSGSSLFDQYQKLLSERSH